MLRSWLQVVLHLGPLGMVFELQASGALVNQSKKLSFLSTGLLYLWFYDGFMVLLANIFKHKVSNHAIRIN